MKLTYWVCENLKDRPCYSIRTKTRREAVYLSNHTSWPPGSFGKPVKVTLEYADAFDLMRACLSEGLAR